jgi:ribose-phosphate pyrophosphokinase
MNYLTFLISIYITHIKDKSVMYILLGNSLEPSLRDYFNARVSNNSQLTLLEASIGKFVSSEAFSEIKANPETIKDKPVTIIQSLSAADEHSSNDLSLELLLTIKTLKRYGAGPVWVVCPFLAYGRQDRTIDDRLTSIGLDDYAALLKSAGAEGISTIELHSDNGMKLLQTHFGKDSAFNLDPTDIYLKYLSKNISSDLSVGGPDAGASVRAEQLSSSLGAEKFCIGKTHTDVNQTKITDFDGTVNNTTITVDDMIDTGGTILNSQLELSSRGAKDRMVLACHGIFSQGSLKRLFEAKTENEDKEYLISKLVVTNSIDIGNKLQSLKSQYGKAAVDKRVKQLNVGPLVFSHIKNQILKHPKMKSV